MRKKEERKEKKEKERNSVERSPSNEHSVIALLPQVQSQVQPQPVLYKPTRRSDPISEESFSRPTRLGITGSSSISSASHRLGNGFTHTLRHREDRL